MGLQWFYVILYKYHPMLFEPKTIGYHWLIFITTLPHTTLLAYMGFWCNRAYRMRSASVYVHVSIEHGSSASVSVLRSSSTSVVSGESYVCCAESNPLIYTDEITLCRPMCITSTIFTQMLCITMTYIRICLQSSLREFACSTL